MTRKISIAEPITHLKHIKIEECGEPLLPYFEECPALWVAAPRWNYERVHFARESVVRQLCRAATVLPKKYRIAIVEGWRAPHIQVRLYRMSWNRFAERHPDWGDAALRRLVNRFTAPPTGPVPPPHTTGGAVDLVLTDAEGHEVDVTSPYERWDPHGFPFDAPKLSPTAREHRRILADALLEGGITNYPSEWWHWSHGDQGWAYRTGAPVALYGPTTPTGYNPDPAEIIDEPVERVFDDLPGPATPSRP